MGSQVLNLDIISDADIVAALRNGELARRLYGESSWPFGHCPLAQQLLTKLVVRIDSERQRLLRGLGGEMYNVRDAATKVNFVAKCIEVTIDNMLRTETRLETMERVELSEVCGVLP